MEVEIPTLRTARLVLRPFREEDHVPLHAMMQDPDVVRFIGDRKTPTRQEAWRAIAGWIGHWALRGYGAWAVEERVSGALIGRIGFINPAEWPALELGYMLGKAYWGRGFATEGCRAALDWGFGSAGFERVISLIDPTNTASIAVATRLGESLAGEAELLGHRLGVYAIDRATWQAQRGASQSPR
jgi:RimJ/RimL family protein N-acetyltransferase